MSVTRAEPRGPYVRLFDLSEGGMGRVELTVRKDGRFERLYAVKRLQPSVQGDPDARAMFLEEARLGGLIRGPNVVSVLDVGEDAEGPFLVMEYVDGITVRDLVTAAIRTRIPLSVQLCCDVAAQAARGLATAHDLTSHDGTPLHLVHRDVSPRNILIDYDGVVRVADFGIARALGRDHRTSTGILKGKLGYMSPEVLRFEPAGPRSDLFSFGVVLFEMLALTRLYGGRDDAERASRILHEPPPDIGEVRDDVPPELQQLLVRLLAKEPQQRPADASEVAATLDRVAAELAAEEGEVDVAEFIGDVFGARRETRRRDLEAALSVIGARPSPVAEPRVSPRRGAAAALALGVSLAIGSAIVWGWPRGEPVVQASGQALASPPPAPLSGTVHVSLSSAPPGALVVGANLEVRTPAEVELARSTEAVDLRFELDGHETVVERIVPDVDQRLRVRLAEIPRREASAPVDTPRVEPRRRRPIRRRQPTKSAGFDLFSD